jgi:hypothetical protein
LCNKRPTTEGERSRVVKTKTGKLGFNGLTVIVFTGLVVSSAFVTSAALAQATPTLITLDAPGAGTGMGQGTVATVINAGGVIAGYLLDSSGACHGFVRNRDGSYVTFDTPLGQHGVATCPQPTAINAAGVITGVDGDGSFGCANWPDTAGGCGGAHAFLRNPDGTIIVFDAPPDLSNQDETPGFTNSNPGTFPRSINSAGEITGIYASCEQSACERSFLRTTDGAFVSFDPPNANPFTGAGANSINQSGTIAGTYGERDAWVFHVFLRTPDGTFTVIDGPDVDPSRFGDTHVTAINSRGELLGSFSTTNAGPSHIYLRTRDSAFTVFDVPGACDSCEQARGLNNKGTVVGTYLTQTTEGTFATHVFLRAADGTFTTFDAPTQYLAISGTTCINSSDAIVGTYSDANGVNHGFLRPGH